VREGDLHSPFSTWGCFYESQAACGIPSSKRKSRRAR
jgi:hypothetical protein